MPGSTNREASITFRSVVDQLSYADLWRIPLVNPEIYLSRVRFPGVFR